ncbi:hypothetical protein MTR_5g012970 [Medicago truncatula]|uniref:Uncharacterized protein n=1 Tax=Medicago truncatula TaxID=3880 RepID=G7JXE5_MEDTR|nr:hypothetical protein MTR_5g012970 [Medicago truncatula]
MFKLLNPTRFKNRIQPPILNLISYNLHSHPPRPPFDAIAAYNLCFCRRLFLSHITHHLSAANTIAVMLHSQPSSLAFDHSGNTFVTKLN